MKSLETVYHSDFLDEDVPHPIPNVATTSDATLHGLIAIYQRGSVPPQIVRKAGLPPLRDVVAEVLRHELAGTAVSR